MKKFISICLLLLPSLLFADARTGEFFGYKIGNCYSLTKSTKGRLHWLGQGLEIVAENPKKPEKMGEVTVNTTLKTHTIASIRSSTMFTTYEEARTFALHFSEILKAQYKIGKWESLDETLAEIFKVPHEPKFDGPMTLMAYLSKDYRMQILLTEPDVRKKEWLVEISLKPIGTLAAEFNKQAEKEYDELLLERAKKNKQLEGL